MSDPEPVAIVALTIEVVAGGELDRLLTAGASWRWAGHDWQPAMAGEAPTGARIWEVRLAPRKPSH